MKNEILKEIRYALRSRKALILFASFLFFAFLTPLMLKVILPMILSSQFGGEATKGIGDLTDMTQLDCIRNYINNVLQLGSIITSFTLCGLTAAELKDKTWVLPLCAGKRFGWVIGSKVIVFGTLMLFIPIIALIIDYIYSGFLFGFEIGILPIIYGGFLQGTYMLFLISNLIMWGVLIRKPIGAGFMTLATVFGIDFIASLLNMQKWTPSGLLLEAQTLTTSFTLSSLLSFTLTTILILLIIILTLLKLKYLEWDVRVQR